MPPIQTEITNALPLSQIEFDSSRFPDEEAQRNLYEEVVREYAIQPDANLILSESLQADYLNPTNGFQYLYLGDIRWLGNVNPISLLAGDKMVREVGTAVLDVIDEMIDEAMAEHGEKTSLIQVKAFSNKGDGIAILAGPTSPEQRQDPVFQEMFAYFKNRQPQFFERVQGKLAKTKALFVSNVTDEDFDQVGYDKKTYRGIYWSQPRIKMESEDHMDQKKEATFTFMQPRELLRVLGKYRPQLKRVLGEIAEKSIPVERDKNWMRLLHYFDLLSFDHATREVWLELEHSDPEAYWAFFHRIEDLAAFLMAHFPNMRLIMNLEEYVRALKLLNTESYAVGDDFISDRIYASVRKTGFKHLGKSFNINFRRWANIMNIVPGGQPVVGSDIYSINFKPEDRATTSQKEIALPIVPVRSTALIVPPEEPAAGDEEEARSALALQLSQRERVIMTSNTEKTIGALARFVQSKIFEKWDTESKFYFLERVFDPSDKRGAMSLNRLLQTAYALESPKKNIIVQTIDTLKQMRAIYGEEGKARFVQYVTELLSSIPFQTLA